jgi:NADH-quinone oxidoreductase subunit C
VTAISRITAAMAEGTFEAAPTLDGMPCVAVPADGVRAFMECLRNETGFETNTFVTAIDRSAGALGIEPCYEVTYQFLSITHVDRIRVRVRISLTEPKIASIADLWPGTGFSERECYDMFGITFEGNPDLRRLLMPEGYDHHPLRKDFPHRGIEPDRLYREWERGRAKSR